MELILTLEELKVCKKCNDSVVGTVSREREIYAQNKKLMEVK